MKWRKIIIYWCFVGEAGFSNYFRISWIISAAVFIVTILIDSNSWRLLIIQTTCSSTSCGEAEINFKSGEGTSILPKNWRRTYLRGHFVCLRQLARDVLPVIYKYFGDYFRYACQLKWKKKFSYMYIDKELLDLSNNWNHPISEYVYLLYFFYIS